MLERARAAEAKVKELTTPYPEITDQIAAESVTSYGGVPGVKAYNLYGGDDPSKPTHTPHDASRKFVAALHNFSPTHDDPLGQRCKNCGCWESDAISKGLHNCAVEVK